MWVDGIDDRDALTRARAPALLLLALVAGCASTRPVVTLETEGGEAWTFVKSIEGVIAAGRCDQVLVRTEHASSSAALVGNRFRALAPLREGENSVHAECVEGTRTVARSTAQEWSLRLPERPKAWIRLRTSGPSVWLDAGRSETAQGSPAPLTRYEWFASANNPAPLLDIENRALTGLEGQRIEVAAPRAEGEYYLTLRITDALGRVDESTTMFRVERGRAQEVRLATEHPAWVDRAVVYGVAPFFFEGGFAGVRERLDEIAAVGATALWISPITAAASDDFGYAVVDYFRLRPDFGDAAEFRALVERAHALGLKVLIDFVPNHLSIEHRYFADLQRNGPRSAYRAWFDRDDEGDVTHYFDWSHLKNLEYDNQEVQNHVIAAFAHWVREFDVDGFRVDASWGVRERAPEFWPRWRAELKRIDPDLFLLAESSARDPYYFENGFDAAYDWTDKLGEWAWRDVFGEGRVDLARLRAALANESGGSDALTFRFLNNNDTGERFFTRHGAPLAKLAATLLFTLPGVPLIYNGDEVGAAFEPYDEGPPIDWRDPHGMSAHYATLARMRQEHAALRSRELELLSTAADDAVLVYVRPGASARQDLLVMLNFGERAREVRLPDGWRAGEMEDVLTRSRVRRDAKTDVVTLGPMQAQVWSRLR